VESGTSIAARQQAAREEEAARAARRLSRRRAFLALTLLVAVAVVVRLPLLAFPMGSEAGILGYVGRRWIAGWLPYREAWDTQMPGIYAIAGVLVRGLGPSVLACRLGMFACELGTLLVVYFLVRQWCNRTEAVAAAGLYGFFSGAIRIQGDCLSASSPMAFLVAFACLAALRSEGRKLGWLVLCGLAGGLAACVELAAALYVATLMLWVAATGGPGSGRATRWIVRPGVILLGALLPMAACVAYFAHCRGLVEFWRSAFAYNYLYHSPLSRGAHWAVSARQAVRQLAPEQGALWLFAAGWAIHAFSVGFRRETGFIALWGVVAIASVFIDYEVEAERFLEAVPPLAIGAALAATNPSEPFLRRDASGRLESRSILLVLFTVALALGFLWAEWRGYNGRTAQGDRDRAAAEVARIIRARTTSRDRIYVWGSWPQIYVLADRPAAHRIFYNRPLNSPQLVREYFGPGIFDEITRAIEKAEPCFVVTTEDVLPEHIERMGAMAPLFYWLQGNYDLSWKIVEAQPYMFTITARKDRAGMP
jgi:hypothetical protein